MGDAFAIGCCVAVPVLLLIAFLSALGYRFDRRRGSPEPIDLAQMRTVREGDRVLRRMIYGPCRTCGSTERCDAGLHS